MASIRQEAEAYEPRQTKNIADLREVDIDLVLFEKTKVDTTGKEYTYKYVEVDGDEYRIPEKVLGDLKAILAKKPTLKKFSVTKKGTGQNTQYTVIPMD